MKTLDTSLNVVMFVSTIVLVVYGLTKGFDTIELIINITYFAALILYLIRNNFIKGGLI
jgi:hypothetical protein